MSDLLTTLPNLSIGVVSILGLVYVVLKFLEALDKQSQRHERAMQEREEALRRVEKEVRTEVTAQLAASTSAASNTARVMERVLTHLDNH